MGTIGSDSDTMRDMRGHSIQNRGSRVSNLKSRHRPLRMRLVRKRCYSAVLFVSSLEESSAGLKVFICLNLI